MYSAILAAMVFCPPPCDTAAEAAKTFSTPRFTLHIGATRTSDLGASPYVEGVADESLRVLNDTYDELTRIFETRPNQRVILRFLTPEEFHDTTGSPSWTSAMYFGGEITVPVKLEDARSARHLKRALRHEYVHAVIAELSGSRCPAWFDEGLAQLIEGEANPLLGPALRNWIRHHQPLPLDSLQNGFTLIDDALVPTAYAQSLFATRTLVNTYGFRSVRKYLKLLRESEPEPEAFRAAFQLSRETFERQLDTQITRWASSTNPHP